MLSFIFVFASYKCIEYGCTLAGFKIKVAPEEAWIISTPPKSKIKTKKKVRKVICDWPPVVSTDDAASVPRDAGCMRAKGAAALQPFTFFDFLKIQLLCGRSSTSALHAWLWERRQDCSRL